MRLFALHCGGSNVNLAKIEAFDPDPARVVYEPFFMYAITHPRGLVLFDTGAHPMLGTDPASRLELVGEPPGVDLGPDDSLAGCLRRIGRTPADVTDVVMSHLHYDHAGGLELLTRARIHIQAAELEFARKPPVYQRCGYTPADFEHDLDWRTLDGGIDLFGDGLLEVVPTPGHTPGHQSLLVHLPERAVFLLADAATSVYKMRERRLPAFLWSPDAVVESWKRIEALERRHDAVLIATHELSFRASIRLAPESWYA